MAPVSTGDLVRIHYTSRSLEGSVIETSDLRNPLEFRVGAEDLIPGLSLGLIGMQLGESRTITAPPERAFGRQNPELVQSVPVSLLPEQAQAGDQLAVSLHGTTLDVWIQKRSRLEAVIDANHPLAGETLVIDVKVVGHVPRS